MNEQRKEWMNTRKNERVNERMSKWKNAWLHESIEHVDGNQMTSRQNEKEWKPSCDHSTSGAPTSKNCSAALIKIQRVRNLTQTETMSLTTSLCNPIPTPPQKGRI